MLELNRLCGGGGRKGTRLMDTGIVRKLDPLGRIVIPVETRRLFNIRESDLLAISVEGDRINMRRLEASCTFCGATEGVGSFRGKGVCENCTAELSAKA